RLLGDDQRSRRAETLVHGCDQLLFFRSIHVLAPFRRTVRPGRAAASGCTRTDPGTSRVRPVRLSRKLKPRLCPFARGATGQSDKTLASCLCRPPFNSKVLGLEAARLLTCSLGQVEGRQAALPTTCQTGRNRLAG